MPLGRWSLVPVPARSYVHTREISDKDSIESKYVLVPAESYPASATIVGEPLP